MVRRSIPVLVLALAAALALAACDDEETGAGGADTALEVDASDDSAGGDTDAPDTTPADTGAPDTAPADTGVLDTTPADTGALDTAATDAADDTGADAAGDADDDTVSACGAPLAACVVDGDCCEGSTCAGVGCGEADGPGVCSFPDRPPCGCGAEWTDCSAPGQTCLAAGCDHPGVCLAPAELLEVCQREDLSSCLACPLCGPKLCVDVPPPACASPTSVRTYTQEWLGCGDGNTCLFAFTTTPCGEGKVCEEGACVAEPVGACQPTSESDLPGVSLTLTTSECTYTLAQAAAGLVFTYEVAIDAPVAGVEALPQDAGGCGQPGPSGLIVFGRVQGGEQSYCICDEGLCMGPDGTTTTLDAGAWPGTFDWDGVNWFGPSDFGNPKGDPFPPGTYTLSLSAKGTRDGAPFEVRATAEITLVP